MPIERRQLVHFLAVVEEGSVSAAARRLHFAQPSVSQAIRELEREVGLALFHRRRGMAITSAGRALIGPARRALRALDSAKAAVDQVGELITGEVDIGVISTLAIHPLVDLVATFHHQHPGVQIRVFDAAPSAPAFEMLDRGDVELLLHDHPSPVHGYDELFLGGRDPVAAFSPEFPSIPDGAVTLEQLVQYPAVSFAAPGGALRVRLSALLAEHGLPLPRAVIQTPHYHSLLPLVLRNVGVTIMPEGEAALAAALGAIVRPFAFALERRYAIYARREERSPAAAAFLVAASTATPG
jgi:DNA-binding transcriptional LysR family regulator